MKLSHLIISGLPKSFNLWDAVEYVQPLQEGMDPDDILIDAYPAECDEDKGEDACVLFKYDESATGVEIVHNLHLQMLTLWLSDWAVEADVMLYVSFINAVLAKHKRARLYDKYAPLAGLTDDDAQAMIKARKAYLKRLLATRDGFTMEGVNADYSLKVAHLSPDISPDIQVLELQRRFVEMQWEEEESPSMNEYASGS